MSRSKSPKSDKELVSSPHEPKSHSPVDTPPSTDLNVIEERYLKVLGSTADKEVNEILLACGIARKESTILIQKGRLHSIRKFLTLTEEKWSQLMTISNNITINNFKNVVSFQLWYHKPKNAKFQQDHSILLAKLQSGNFRQYLQGLSLLQAEIERDISESESEKENKFVLAKKKKILKISKPNIPAESTLSLMSSDHVFKQEPTTVPSNPFKNNPFAPFMDAYETFEDSNMDFKDAKPFTVMSSESSSSKGKKENQVAIPSSSSNIYVVEKHLRIIPTSNPSQLYENMESREEVKIKHEKKMRCSDQCDDSSSDADVRASIIFWKRRYIEPYKP